MAFKLDDIVIDRVQYAVAENNKGELLYVLTQLSDASIELTAESKDAVDAQGTLIKRFYNAKTGEFSASNAMINVNLLAAETGDSKLTATEEAAIEMPKIITVKAGETVTLKDYKAGTVHVNALGANGALGQAYEVDTAAGTDKYALTSAGVFTPPTDPEVTRYVVKYQRDVKSGVALVNKADKFPQTVKLTLKALCVDPCTVDTLRACYIVLPSFQLSPEVTITLDTEGTMDFSGSLQVDFLGRFECYQILF